MSSEITCLIPFRPNCITTLLTASLPGRELQVPALLHVLKGYHSAWLSLLFLPFSQSVRSGISSAFQPLKPIMPAGITSEGFCSWHPEGIPIDSFDYTVEFIYKHGLGGQSEPYL